MKTILWWGRSEPDYSRNRLILKLLRELDWRVAFFHPLASRFGKIEAFFRQPAKPDLIWVPCFRQRDMHSALHWAQKWQVPVVVDPLISAYQKEVFEKKKYPPGSPAAENLKKWEGSLLAAADMVIADTPAHADFFAAALGVDARKTRVIYVGADTEMFVGTRKPEISPPYEVLFYGSFLHLQGIDTIIEAARRVPRQDIHWVLLGDGGLRPAMEKLAAGIANLSFEPWVDFQQLPDRIARADILLGVFGTTPKADLVIPNKVFQSMAAGRPLITRRAASYPKAIADSDIIGWVDGGDAAGLARLVQQWLEQPAALIGKGQETRQLFDRYFNENTIRQSLSEVLARVLPTP